MCTLSRCGTSGQQFSYSQSDLGSNVDIDFWTFFVVVVLVAAITRAVLAHGALQSVKEGLWEFNQPDI